MSMDYLVWYDSRKLSKSTRVLPKELRCQPEEVPIDQRWDNWESIRKTNEIGLYTWNIFKSKLGEKKYFIGHSLVDEKEPNHYFEIQ